MSKLNRIYIGTIWDLKFQGPCQQQWTHLQNLALVHIAAALALAVAGALAASVAAAAPGVARKACGVLREVLGAKEPSVQVPSVQRPHGSRPWIPWTFFLKISSLCILSSTGPPTAMSRSVSSWAFRPSWKSSAPSSSSAPSPSWSDSGASRGIHTMNYLLLACPTARLARALIFQKTQIHVRLWDSTK